MFFTVVIETTVESLAAWEHRITEIFSLPEFGVWFARMTPLVESGRREFYTITRNQGKGLRAKSIKLIHISTFTRPILVAQVSLENFTRTTLGKSIL
jgi:hypothetical protein